jgi:hypothetical protein
MVLVAIVVGEKEVEDLHGAVGNPGRVVQCHA